MQLYLPNPPCRLLLGDSHLCGYCIPDLICDTHACTSSAKYYDACNSECLTADAQAGSDSRKSDTACSLDIVVEAGHVRAVLVENASS